MPGYGDFLVCGISTQLRQAIAGFDEVLISDRDADFKQSGLLADSVIRLGFLAVLPRRTIIGSIGTISVERYNRLIDRLTRYLQETKRVTEKR
jgi:mRNA interferase MazF